MPPRARLASRPRVIRASGRCSGRLAAAGSVIGVLDRGEFEAGRLTRHFISSLSTTGHAGRRGSVACVHYLLGRDWPTPSHVAVSKVLTSISQLNHSIRLLYLVLFSYGCVQCMLAMSANLLYSDSRQARRGKACILITAGLI